MRFKLSEQVNDSTVVFFTDIRGTEVLSESPFNITVEHRRQINIPLTTVDPDENRTIKSSRDSTSSEIDSGSNIIVDKPNSSDNTNESASDESDDPDDSSEADGKGDGSEIGQPEEEPPAEEEEANGSEENGSDGSDDEGPPTEDDPGQPENDKPVEEPPEGDGPEDETESDNASGLTVQLIDAQTGDPIPKGTVDLKYFDPPNLRKVTDSNGQMTFDAPENDDSSLDYYLYAEAAGYRDAETSFPANDVPSDIVIEMEAVDRSVDRAILTANANYSGSSVGTLTVSRNNKVVSRKHLVNKARFSVRNGAEYTAQAEAQGNLVEKDVLINGDTEITLQFERDEPGALQVSMDNIEGLRSDPPDNITTTATVENTGNVDLTKDINLEVSTDRNNLIGKAEKTVTVAGSSTKQVVLTTAADPVPQGGETVTVAVKSGDDTAQRTQVIPEDDEGAGGDVLVSINDVGWMPDRAYGADSPLPLPVEVTVEAEHVGDNPTRQPIRVKTTDADGNVVAEDSQMVEFAGEETKSVTLFGGPEERGAALPLTIEVWSPGDSDRIVHDPRETDSNTPAPEPTETPEPTSEPTETPTSEPTDTPTSEPTETPTETSTTTETETQTAEPAETPSETSTPTETETGTETETETPTETSTSTETVTPTQTETSTPTQTETETPTETPTPTPTETETATETETEEEESEEEEDTTEARIEWTQSTTWFP